MSGLGLQGVGFRALEGLGVERALGFRVRA